MAYKQRTILLGFANLTDTRLRWVRGCELRYFFLGNDFHDILVKAGQRSKSVVQK